MHHQVNAWTNVKNDQIGNLYINAGLTTSLLQKRSNDFSTSGIKDWPFMTVHNWGEDPFGMWELTISDKVSNKIESYALPFISSMQNINFEAALLLHNRADASIMCCNV